MTVPGRLVIGVDESGKGDFFGPLVVAAFLAPDSVINDLTALGVKDGKTLSDKRVLEIDVQLRRLHPYALDITPPDQYNLTYEKIRNLNHLLAAAHARAIDTLLHTHPADHVVIDQFGKADLVAGALAKHGHTIPLEQRFRAEEIPQVAAASIIARAEFLRQLGALSERFALTLPKGAAPMVDKAGRDLVRLHGADALRLTAKVHFKNFQRVVNPSLSSR